MNALRRHFDLPELDGRTLLGYVVLAAALVLVAYVLIWVFAGLAVAMGVKS